MGRGPDQNTIRSDDVPAHRDDWDAGSKHCVTMPWHTQRPSVTVQSSPEHTESRRIVHGRPDFSH